MLFELCGLCPEEAADFLGGESVLYPLRYYCRFGNHYRSLSANNNILSFLVPHPEYPGLRVKGPSRLT